jgi:hypothetical protein
MAGGLNTVIETLTRRKLIGGLGLLIAAPAIVRMSSLMPVKRYVVPFSIPLTAAQIGAILDEMSFGHKNILDMRDCVFRQCWKDICEIGYAASRVSIGDLVTFEYVPRQSR